MTLTADISGSLASLQMCVQSANAGPCVPVCRLWIAYVAPALTGGWSVKTAAVLMTNFCHILGFRMLSDSEKEVEGIVTPISE